MDKTVHSDNIRRVVIPDTILSMDGNPYGYNTALEEIAVSPDHPAFVTENGLLIDRTAKRILICPPGIPAEKIVVPGWITSIAPFAFCGCSRIRSVVLPDSTTEIGEGAFLDCCCLEEIRLPSGLPEIAPLTFSNCESLRQVILPEGILRIGDFAFASCGSLLSLRLPGSVEFLGNYAFTCCESLEKINLPQCLQNIGLPPFSMCIRLKNIVLPAIPGRYSTDGSLLIDRKLQEVVCCFPGIQEKTCIIPSGIKSIGPFAFSGIPQIREINYPDSLVSIGKGAFENCEGLEHVKLPPYLSVLEDYAFIGCRNLKSLTLPDSVQFFGVHCFSLAPSLQITVSRASAGYVYCRLCGISCQEYRN